MSEYKGEILAASAVAVAAAIVIGVFAITWLPVGTTATATAVTSTSSIGSDNTTGAINPRLLAGILFSQDVTCYLGNGTCTMILLNNGTSPSYDVAMDSCSMDVITGSNGTVTTYDSANGSVMGPATSGISSGARVSGGCSVPTAKLGYETKGQIATGIFVVSLVHSLYDYPPGSRTIIEFESTWS